MTTQEKLIEIAQFARTLLKHEDGEHLLLALGNDATRTQEVLSCCSMNAEMVDDLFGDGSISTVDVTDRIIEKGN